MNMKAIARGIDNNKDQSYFVYKIRKEQLDHILFPIGEFEDKNEVREYAQSKGLITSSKPDSQGLCFVGQTSLRELLLEVLGQKVGNIYTIMSIESFNKIGFNTERNFSKSRLQKLDGQNYKIQIGTHDGAFLYTIGQRQNLGISNGPWTVSKVDIENNEIIVTHKTHESQSLITELSIDNLNWHIETPDTGSKIQCLAQIRYRSKAIECEVVIQKDNSANVVFHSPIQSPATGQSVVLYKQFKDPTNPKNITQNQNPPNQVIIGGGVIVEVTKNTKNNSQNIHKMA
jgi:tRNA-uridine 2-sulfurtransferase